MQPTIPIPTDNIYKFSCLFGLALIVTVIFSFVSVYNSSLEKKIKYFDVVTALEAKKDKTDAENKLLEKNKNLIELTRDNEKTANQYFGAVLVIGLLLAILGASMWYTVIQKQDDEIMKLQLRKLAAEVKQLEASANKTDDSDSVAVTPNPTSIQSTKPHPPPAPPAPLR